MRAPAGEATRTGAAAFGLIGAVLGAAAGLILFVVAPVTPLAAGFVAVAVLAAVGGLEIATLVGLLLQAAAGRAPLILDGFITAAAALVATAMCPALPARLIASHRSSEPGHATILQHLGVVPLLDLDLRLGEASGGVLALGLLDASCALRDDMATFESAAVSGPAG